MRYVSTRGGAQTQRFCDILLEGLAADGGLAVPESIPRLAAGDEVRERFRRNVVDVALEQRAGEAAVVEPA